MKLRFLLPLGHGAVDTVLLLILSIPIEFALTHAGFNSAPSPLWASAQEGEVAEFDLEHSTACYHPPTPFLHLAFGTLPAALLSGTYQPCPFFQRERLRKFFLIHEAASLRIWFLIGLAIDRGISNPYLGRRYLCYRALLTVTLPLPILPRFGGLLLFAFWSYIFVWAVARSIAFVYGRCRPRNSLSR